MEKEKLCSFRGLIQKSVLFLLPASLGLHFWAGGVVLKYQSTLEGYFFQIRDAPEKWTRVGPVLYWMQVTVDWLIFSGCVSMLVWVLWRWLWYGALYKQFP